MARSESVEEEHESAPLLAPTAHPTAVARRGPRAHTRGRLSLPIHQAAGGRGLRRAFCRKREGPCIGLQGGGRPIDPSDQPSRPPVVGKKYGIPPASASGVRRNTRQI